MFTIDVWLMLLFLAILGQIYLVLDNYFMSMEKAESDEEGDMESSFAMSMWMGQD